MDSASGGCDEGYSIDIGVEGSACDMEISPGMTKYWRPNCAESLKPHVGQQFVSLDTAFGFYKQYAGSVGFDCRQSTTRKGRDGGVVLKQVNRNLDAGHQLFVASCVRANIGPTRSYRLFKEIVGEYSNVGATGVDFKTFKRDLMAYILNGDAQMFIDTLFKRRELCEAFGFEYDVDEGDQLSRVFLADAVSRKNFSLFGDVVSFDATYRTNRYNLVFVPFTGIDNHKRCITFGAGLLTKEDIDSYVWLLESFKKTMGHDPICVVTNQDPAVKVAIAQVFGASKHRFCMWHIMCKVGEKVGPVLSKDEVFRRKLNGIVWDNSLDPNAFELRLNHIMEEYGLGDNGWFRYLFESRTFWAPPYFHDFESRTFWAPPYFHDDFMAGLVRTPYFHDDFMAGLVRTTSRSESQNSFFGSFSNGHSSLVEFLVHYDTAIGAQRHAQPKLNADCEACVSVLKTPLALEQHARYLVHRWTKGACLHPMFHIDGTLVDQSAKVENVRVLTNLMWSDIYACVGLADGNIDRLSQLRRVINEQRQIFLQDGSENGNGVAVGSKQSVINSFCGDVSMGSTVDVHDPVQAKNKGSGKRLKSARERVASKCAKQSRRCHSCDEYGHNSRTCPLNT
ncbi:protein FAR1-RELATED SEQUENCE 5-like [Ipomoea triloba]|uniref:protein FAR1-RELATED SEQUENCE 5-like n=1 Tax=Ipomoea triloba TaxID=35885 RepID=UPI00125DED0A|nr:protein FAR1-RELATED SEQUENCE 5-like [Ipomoea triloba]